LIGIATWGVIFDNDKLEVDNDSCNYGYLTRKPVFYNGYGKDTKATFLDPNHSHFILVDAGKGKDFGQEIELRCQFEACACIPKRSEEEAAAMETLRKTKLGWEGCQVRTFLSSNPL
jgi:hypothetical protein